MQVVSKKLLSLCLIISILLLSVFSVPFMTNRSYMYVCNEDEILDIYMRKNGKDIVIKPRNIKNMLACIGRGMPYYDRTIESITGSTNLQVKDILDRRYEISAETNRSDRSSYECIEMEKRYLIIQKNIVINELGSAISECEPNSIIAPMKYKETKIVKALISQKYDVLFISKGEFKKIML